ncbi:methyl esterase 1, ARABIDOPSIS THALIANA METHYL ESTERASE 1 [Hibiscus trionum]|uniref:Methyl esterase 1, ARABIDOPSIS THALIANA METHYL ESTERASE 1 n=1 Tax=Hibiscus trionum TaxID=183268 RepID=A0A9W7J5X9_HIBTR|nr:methyl esterase 1, ARABIDOPSIS THALIANA METHYL ESTERASE 1 [Hibiscus trionum]
MAETKNQDQKHFVLVHGLCHGAWCWFKLKPQLESSGHRVTLLDLSASGVNMKPIHDVPTFEEYSRPLLAFLASLNEPAIVVGHSLGGMNLALAMDLFPHKISVGVFLTAFMPDTIHQPSYVIDKCLAGGSEETIPSDFEAVTIGSPEAPFTIRTMGPNFLAHQLYQLSPVEDLELAKTLMRPGSLYEHDLSKVKNFSDQGYGSVTRVFVVCDEDKAIKLEHQRWMIHNNPPQAVMEISGADHMPMLSKTKQLCDILLEIADRHA